MRLPASLEDELRQYAQKRLAEIQRTLFVPAPLPLSREPRPTSRVPRAQGETLAQGAGDRYSATRSR